MCEVKFGELPTEPSPFTPAAEEWLRCVVEKLRANPCVWALVDKGDVCSASHTERFKISNAAKHWGVKGGHVRVAFYYPKDGAEIWMRANRPNVLVRLWRRIRA